MGRHEQHDALRGQSTARTGEATFCTSKTSVARDTAFFSLFDEENAVWGTRPGPVLDPQPQERVQRHILEQAVDVCPFVQIIDAVGDLRAPRHCRARAGHRSAQDITR